MTQNHIPVLCDRCLAEGEAGGPDFTAIGEAIAFEPVPRKQKRVNGWDADTQRAFIAALAATGSARRAAIAVGRASWGADQLRRAKGGESFAEAWDKAMAIAEAKDRHRRAARFEAATGSGKDSWLQPSPRGRAAPRPAAPAAGASSDPEHDPVFDPGGEELEDFLDWLSLLFSRYLLKLQQEREARLAGEIVAADFYLRQLTHIEVMLDLAGGEGFQTLLDFRKDGHDLLHIAETPLSRLLDEARRMKWAELGEPERPEHPPRRYLEHHDGYSTEPLEYCRGDGPDLAEQQRAFEERHAKDAAEQIEWEARARRDFESRSASSTRAKSRDAPGRPACAKRHD